MKYVSVCSGIEAATMAWHNMGWKPLAFSEIEKFPSAVLAHHYPNVTNEGDFTTIGDKYDLTNGLLVGGTPCQSFSVAGLRKGMDDERGNLALEFLKLARDTRAKWVVWENVPGVLSSNGGRDFGAILGGLEELGYGWAYRILDAQYFGVAQRRRRVFVVGHLGSWQRAAAVLFEQASLSGHTPPSREAGKGVTCNAESSIGGYREEDCGGTLKASGGVLSGGSETFIAKTLTTSNERLDPGVETMIVEPRSADGVPRVHTNGLVPTLNTMSGGQREPCVCIQGSMVGRKEENGPQGDGVNEETSFTLNATDKHAVCFTQNDGGRDASVEIAPTMRSGGDGGLPNQAVAIPINSMTVQGRPSDNGRMGLGIGEDGDPQNTLSSAHHHAVALMRMRSGCEGGGKGPLVQEEKSGTIATANDQTLFNGSQVRRLTPIECERLQGFPDDFTKIPWRNKDIDDCPDGPRYKALGNSMAVPVMAFIGHRIEKVNAM